MNLPNYFLADLPPEATLSPDMLAEACRALKRNREQYLATRSTDQLVRLLAQVAEGWLAPDSAFRRCALEKGPAQTGFGPATLAHGLDGFFKQLTRENLRELLVQDLGGARRLDEPCATIHGARSRFAMAVGPEFLVHVTAGNVPNPALMSMVLGVLTRAAQFVKCASGAAFLPRLFAHSIYEADHKLGACLEIAEWRGGNAPLEQVLFEEADCVTATGSDQTLAAIRARLPMRTRFLGYGHRVSFGYVAGEMLTGSGAKHLAAAAADDVVAWNQLGCLSPHVIYAQTGGEVTPARFAELLADELERREAVEPRGAVPVAIAATIASRREIYAVRAAHSADTQMWRSADSTAWTVVYEEDPRFQISCLHRFVYVKPARDLAEALQSAESVRGAVSTVGLAAAADASAKLAAQLARWGATRICPLGQMQNPALVWRHDGRPSLGDLVTWTDWEK